MKKILLSFIVVLILHHKNVAQEERTIDSLKKILSERSPVKNSGGSLRDSSTVRLLIELSKLHWGNDPTAASNYAQKALRLSKNIGYHAGIALAYHCLGTAEEDFGNYLKALEYYEASLEIRERRNDQKGIAAVYNNMGIIFYHQANFPRALENFLKALSIEEKIQNVLGIANGNLNVGAVYVEQGNHNKALAHFGVALKAFKKSDSQQGAALITNNIAAVQQNLGQYEKAIALFNEALVINKKIGDRKGYSRGLNNIGETYKTMGRFEDAIRYFEQSLAIKEDIADKKGIAAIKSSMGIVYANLGKLEKALSVEKQALDLSLQLGARELIRNTYGNLSTVYAKMRNFQAAYEYAQKFKQEHDSLFNSENEKKVTELQMQYEFDKKEALTRAQQEKRDKITELAAQQHRRERLYYGVIGAILFLAVLALWSRLTLVRKTKKLLEEKNRQIQAEKVIAEQQRVRAELMDIRHKIAKDLHDDIGSSLSSISIYSEVAGKLTAGQAPEVNKILVNVGKIALDAMENMNDIVWTINPMNDKLDDIMQRLHVLSAHLKEASNIVVHFDVPDNIHETTLTMNQRKNIYLIFKEAINNIAKYAGASNCFVRIEKNGDLVIVNIRDDGNGFDQRTASLGGNGIINMEKRAAEMNGTFELRSAPLKGTELSFSFKT
jgi:signal transduction histidine kinase